MPFNSQSIAIWFPVLMAVPLRAISKEDADYGITTNGIWVSENKYVTAAMDNRHVLLEGGFDRKDRGHMSAWQGSIKDVSRVYELTKFEKPR